MMIETPTTEDTMRRPIGIDRPSAKELAVLRDRQRSTSLVYEHLLTKYGLSVAERWLDALDITRASDALSLAVRAISPTGGWIMSATAASERIAKKTHEIPEPHVMEMSLRSWREARQRDSVHRPHAY